MLRTEDLQLIFSFRFYIADLSTQLHRLSNKQKNTIDILYRGQIMFKEEFEKFQSNIGSLISVNTFFSTSKDIKVARASRNIKTGDIVKVLFYII
jgi:hypothetical protein